MADIIRRLGQSLLPATLFRYIEGLGGTHALMTATLDEGHVAEDSYTRPNNATQYTIDDALNATAPVDLTFSSAAIRNGGRGWIIGVTVTGTANQAALPSMRLFLFTVPPNPVADNTAFTITDEAFDNCLGYADLDTWVSGQPTAGAGGNAMSQSALANPIAFACAPDNPNLYGMVKLLNTYTPVALERFTFKLRIERS